MTFYFRWTYLFLRFTFYIWRDFFILADQIYNIFFMELHFKLVHIIFKMNFNSSQVLNNSFYPCVSFINLLTLFKKFSKWIILLSRITWLQATECVTNEEPKLLNCTQFYRKVIQLFRFSVFECFKFFFFIVLQKCNVFSFDQVQFL